MPRRQRRRGCGVGIVPPQARRPAGVETPDELSVVAPVPERRLTERDPGGVLAGVLLVLATHPLALQLDERPALLTHHGFPAQVEIGAEDVRRGALPRRVRAVDPGRAERRGDRVAEIEVLRNAAQGLQIGELLHGIPLDVRVERGLLFVDETVQSAPVGVVDRTGHQQVPGGRREPRELGAERPQALGPQKPRGDEGLFDELPGMGVLEVLAPERLVHLARFELEPARERGRRQEDLLELDGGLPLAVDLQDQVRFAVEMRIDRTRAGDLEVLQRETPAVGIVIPALQRFERGVTRRGDARGGQGVEGEVEETRRGGPRAAPRDGKRRRCRLRLTRPTGRIHLGLELRGEAGPLGLAIRRGWGVGRGRNRGRGCARGRRRRLSRGRSNGRGCARGRRRRLSRGRSRQLAVGHLDETHRGHETGSGERAHDHASVQARTGTSHRQSVAIGDRRGGAGHRASDALRPAATVSEREDRWRRRVYEHTRPAWRRSTRRRPPAAHAARKPWGRCPVHHGSPRRRSDRVRRIESAPRGRRHPASHRRGPPGPPSREHRRGPAPRVRDRRRVSPGRDAAAPRTGR